MQQNNMSVVTVNCTINRVYDNGSTTGVKYPTLDVIYTGARLRRTSTSADVFVANYFLTHYRVGWICSGESYYLNYYASSSETYTIVRTKKDGTTATVTGTANAGTSSILVSFVTDTVKAVVTMGYRTFTLYYLDMEWSERFQFRNVFNAVEYLSFPASVTESPSTEYEEAQQDKIMQRYDVEHKLEIKIKTPLLPAFTYPHLLDMCRSRLVKRHEPFKEMSSTYYEYSEVNIKEYKFDKSNEPNSPIMLELTLNYCDTERNSAIEFL